ncbi:MAG: hypothetical protein AAFO69_21310, partial [Bacteroidota bacterium]
IGTVVNAMKYVLIAKSMKLAERVHASLFGDKGDELIYKCDVEIDRSKAIARHLLENWKVAKKLVEAHGGKFISILQPQLYSGSPNRTYLEDHSYFGDFLKDQYLAIYPEITHLIEEENASFIYDFTDAFDGNQAIYYDICHTNSKGNLIIAKKVKDVINSQSFGETSLMAPQSQ